MDAIIPAAGRGSRLGTLTADRPKPLVPVGDRPLIERVLDAVIPADPDTIAMIVGYRGEQVIDALGDEYRGTPIEYATQTERLGLAHAVAEAEPYVDGPILVCNGDNVLGGDLRSLAAAHEGAATLLVEEAEPERAKRTGVVVTDGGRVERVVEKPDDPPSTLVSAGAFVFSSAVFEACRAIEPSDRGEYELSDAVTWLVEHDHRVGIHRFDGERVNVNTPMDIARARRLIDGDA